MSSFDLYELTGGLSPQEIGDSLKRSHQINKDGISAEDVKYSPRNGIDRDVAAKLNESLSINDFGGKRLSSPFGDGGFRVLVGDKNDRHTAFGSVCEVPDSNKWLLLYRSSNQHGISNGSELRIAESYDFGDSWINDRVIYQDSEHDARPDKLTIMSNNRIGFFVNRQDEGDIHFSPLFFKSDDEGNTWSSVEQTTDSPYTFQSVGGIVEFPASQGGHDTEGFITFGTLNAGSGIDYFYTTDNGESWDIGYDAGFPSNNIERISENVSVRLGDTDRWLIYCRAESIGGGWHGPLSVFSTTNLLDWGEPLDAGVDNLGTSPCAFYDETTNKIYSIGTARVGREIDGLGNHLLIVGDDIEDLWLHNGVFSKQYDVLCAAPNWLTGYVMPFKSRGRMMAAFSAGEPVSNTIGSSSAMFLIGDFKSSGLDASIISYLLMKRQHGIKSIGFVTESDDIDEMPVSIINKNGLSLFELGLYREVRNTGGIDFNGTYIATNAKITKNFVCNILEIKASNNIFFNADGVIGFGHNVLFGGLEDKIDDSSAAIHVSVGSSSIPSIRSASIGSSSNRQHFVFSNPNGVVGSISTSGSSSGFNTTSDETLKNFSGKYSGVEALDIISKDPVRHFSWKKSGETAIGWGAQTSYAVSQDLATKGGWFIDGDDGEVDEGTKGAKYVPWGVDQSKRTPYLWAAVSELHEYIKKLTDRVAELENNIE